MLYNENKENDYQCSEIKRSTMDRIAINIHFDVMNNF